MGRGRRPRHRPRRRGHVGRGHASGDPITLKFQSLAFQDSTIAATQAIVDAWNTANPDVQVEILQGSWDNASDQLTTQFAGGTAPDIIHFESAAIGGFAQQGYLADLSPYLSDDVKASVSDDIWATVSTPDGAIIAAPTLLQSYVVFANTDVFDAAGVAVPTGDTMTWDDFAALSKSLTNGDTFGLGWGLKSPTATVMNLALGFDGTFFTTEGDTTSITVGDNELAVPQRIHDMAYVDKSLDPVSLTQSGGDVLPGFFGGTYAMYVGGNYIAQQITETGPEGFNWTVLPLLEGSAGTNQAANPQTLSVSSQSEHVEQAAGFVNFFMDAQNLASVAEGDWLIPSSGAAREQVATDTNGENSWPEILASGDSLRGRPVPVGDQLPAVEGPDRHPGPPAVLRRPDRPRQPAEPVDRRLGTGVGRLSMPDGTPHPAFRHPAAMPGDGASGTLTDAACGALSGAAVGDALGGATEGYTPDDIQRRHGGYVTGIVAPFNEDWRDARPIAPYHKGDGHVTDDTLLTLALVDVYAEVRGHLDAYAIAAHLVPRLIGARQWIPELEAEALLVQRLFLAEKWLVARLHYGHVDPREAGVGNIVNCGAAMYMAPVGIVNAGDPAGAYAEAIDVTGAHQSSYGREAAGVFAAAVAEAMRPGASISTVVDAAVGLAHDGTRQAIEAVADAAAHHDEWASALGAVRDAVAPFDTVGPDYRAPALDARRPSRTKAIEELPVALGLALVTGGDYTESVLAACNYGRDADSIATMAGAVTGALGGMAAVPERLADDRRRRRAASTSSSRGARWPRSPGRSGPTTLAPPPPAMRRDRRCSPIDDPPQLVAARGPPPPRPRRRRARRRRRRRPPRALDRGGRPRRGERRRGVARCRHARVARAGGSTAGPRRRARGAGRPAPAASPTTSPPSPRSRPACFPCRARRRSIGSTVPGSVGPPGACSASRWRRSDDTASGRSPARRGTGRSTRTSPPSASTRRSPRRTPGTDAAPRTAWPRTSTGCPRTTT